MSDTSLVLILLSVMSGCLVTLTVLFFLTAQDFRRTLHRINTILPDAGHTFHEAGRALAQVRRLLTRVNASARQIGAVVDRTCEAASVALDRFDLVRERAQSTFSKWTGLGNGHGTGAGPRSHGRRRS